MPKIKIKLTPTQLIEDLNEGELALEMGMIEIKRLHEMIRINLIVGLVVGLGVGACTTSFVYMWVC